MIMNKSELLLQLAEQYETADFLQGDPSWFMHQTEGHNNREVMAFIAAALSFGNRSLFMPKISLFLEKSSAQLYDWVLKEEYTAFFTSNNTNCFYRFYTSRDIYFFLRRLGEVLNKYGSLQQFIALKAHSGYDAVKALVEYFKDAECGIIPKSTDSACKRLCMFLRWMVRDNSPVDLGLWKDIIDKSTLIIPLDTHVIQQANRLQLISSTNANMTTALRLTNALKQYFPNDPTKADFALFGYGVSRK